MNRLTRVEFENFKALRKFTLGLEEVNILVGPNNCGKSTILSAFRILEVALRRAHSRRAERVQGPSGATLGYGIAKDALPISLENVHSDYDQADSSIRFHFSDSAELHLFFPTDGGCVLIPNAPGKSATTPGNFKRVFNIRPLTVPVLGPLEHDEQLREEKTVKQAAGTHVASRHFRNYWRVFPGGFEAFARMVSKTWPGMEIDPPELMMGTPPRVVMFCREGGFSRELFWAGFGFQIWCQLLTHLSRAKLATHVIIDEPEIYLHPDVQRQLLDLLRALGPSVILATHSTELISEAELSELVTVDKSKRKGHRLRDVEGVQEVLESIGSVHNVSLTKLARTRRVLFVEGQSDYRRLRLFARKLGLLSLAQGDGVSPVESGGFSSWRQIRDLAAMLERTLGTALSISVVYDRDFWCEEEIEEISKALAEVVTHVHFHGRKELENYLLVPTTLQRLLDRQSGESKVNVEALLMDLTGPMKTPLLAQYISKREHFLKHSKNDSSTVNEDTIARFEGAWATLEGRLRLASGKRLLGELRTKIQDEYSYSLTDSRIVEAMRREDVAEDLATCLARLDEYCRGNA